MQLFLIQYWFIILKKHLFFLQSNMRTSSFIFALLVLCVMFTSAFAKGAKKNGKKNVSAGSHHSPKSTAGDQEVPAPPAIRRRKRSAITGLIGTATGAAAPATNMLGGVTGLLGGGNAKAAEAPKEEAAAS